MTQGQVPLAEAIEGLRAELERAMTSGEGARLRFEASSVELTMHAAVTDTGGGRAGIKWCLLDFGVEGSHQSQTTQEIKLVLTPRVQGEQGPPLLEGAD